MGSKILHILTYLIVVIVIGGSLYTGFNYYLLRHQNLRFQHPYPKLTKEFPSLRELDKMMTITACIVWDTAIEKHTGKKYLVHEVFSRKGKKNFLDKKRIYLMDYENRNKFIFIPEKQFKKHFWRI